MRSLEQWLAYQAQVHPQTIDLGWIASSGYSIVCEWRQPPVPVITVAGTNGKGSVGAYCAAILTAAGYRVGTFTSPHLRDYRERIRLCGAKIPSEALVGAFERIEAALRARHHIVDFFRVQRIGSDADIRVREARCMGAGGWHGRPP